MNREVMLAKVLLLEKLINYYQALIPPGNSISRAELLASLANELNMVRKGQL